MIFYSRLFKRSVRSVIDKSKSEFKLCRSGSNNCLYSEICAESEFYDDLEDYMHYWQGDNVLACSSTISMGFVDKLSLYYNSIIKYELT